MHAFMHSFKKWKKYIFMHSHSKKIIKKMKNIFLCIHSCSNLKNGKIEFYAFIYAFSLKKYKKIKNRFLCIHSCTNSKNGKIEFYAFIYAFSFKKIKKKNLHSPMHFLLIKK